MSLGRKSTGLELCQQEAARNRMFTLKVATAIYQNGQDLRLKLFDKLSEEHKPFGNQQVETTAKWGFSIHAGSAYFPLLKSALVFLTKDDALTTVERILRKVLETCVSASEDGGSAPLTSEVIAWIVERLGVEEDVNTRNYATWSSRT